MKFERPVFIVFEGLDGSGKSTCAAELAKRIDAELMTTPSPKVRLYRDDLVASLGENQEARQLFYLATVFAASMEISKFLRDGRSVVLDRYFLSTQAYAAFRGSVLDVDDLSHHLQPADLTIYIDTPLKTRVARLSKRGTSAADLETITLTADTQLRGEHFERARLSVVGKFVSVRGDRPLEVVLSGILAEVGIIATV